MREKEKKTERIHNVEVVHNYSCFGFITASFLYLNHEKKS